LTQAKVILELETRGHDHIVDIRHGLVEAGFVLDVDASKGQDSTPH